MRKPIITNPKLTTGKKTNFDNSFLYDFGLADNSTLARSYIWTWGVKAQERFHLPITYYNDGEESEKHYAFKQQVHDYVYEHYYMDGQKYFVTTELKQVDTPFISYIDGAEKVLYTLDVCIIRFEDNQIFNVEIDGTEHLTRGNLMRDDRRDRWLKKRYGVLTHRILYHEYDNVYLKDIDKFIEQPACKNEVYDVNKRMPIFTDSEERIKRKYAGPRKKGSHGVT